MKAFIESQFAYCPLIRIFCQRSSNTRINHLHESGLRIVYNDSELTFEDLLKLDFDQCDMPYRLIICALVQCVRI